MADSEITEMSDMGGNDNDPFDDPFTNSGFSDEGMNSPFSGMGDNEAPEPRGFNRGLLIAAQPLGTTAAAASAATAGAAIAGNQTYKPIAAPEYNGKTAAQVLARTNSRTTGHLEESDVPNIFNHGDVKPAPPPHERSVSRAKSEVGNLMGVATTPFSMVSGKVSRNKWNPMKKKSGMLSVLVHQADHKRIVAKDGDFNARPVAEGKSHHVYLDFFNTILNLSWFWILFMFAFWFFASWLLFAVVWYLIAYIHGDLDPDILASDDHVVCVDNVEDFATAFLFSVETQHTIGYGGRATTNRCAFAIIVMCFQSIVGVIISAAMAGIFFGKFTIPTARGETIIFSRNALVTMRNGMLYLIFNVTDIKRVPLIDVHARLIFIHTVTTDEGWSIKHLRQDLKVTTELEEDNDRLFLAWPTVVAHKIDEDSPLYEMDPTDLHNTNFELVAIVEGTTQETGNSIQVRTSYLPNEIHWGKRFVTDNLQYDEKSHKFNVLHTTINDTVDDATPGFSAKALANMDL